MNKKKIFYNVLSGLFSQAVSFLLAFLIPRLFLVNFGSEIKGMLATITQIFSYLWLLEAGVGLATVQALYAPISRRDRESIRSIMAATDRYYKKTGYIYLCLIFVFALVFSVISKDSMTPQTTFLLVLFQGIPTASGYLLQGKYRLLLEAEGKSYILNNLQIGLQFFFNAGKVFLLYTTDNLLLIQALPCLGTIFQLCFFEYYIHKNYPWLRLKEAIPDYSSIAQKSAVLIHQISGVVFNNTDVILLSMFCGFKVSSVYTVYNSFFTYAGTLINTLSSSITFHMGQVFHSDRQRFFRLQEGYEAGYMMVIFTVYTMVYLFITPVIRLYTDGVNDIRYVDPILPFLFVTINLFAYGKMPCNQVIIFAEHFEKTRHHALIEAGINLVVSIISIQFWGIYGALAGTIAALIYRGNIMIFYANKIILHCSPWRTYKKWLINLTAFFFIIAFLHPEQASENTWGSVFIQCIGYGILVSVFYITINCIAQPAAAKFFAQYVKDQLLQKR